MKAALLRAPNEIACEIVSEPELARGDLLVKVKAATVCGTDVRIFRGKKTTGIRYPSILGHEFAGEIVDTGGNATFMCGEAVGVCPAIPCGHCANCKRGFENICSNLIAIGYEIDGAFAEYIRIPARAVESENVFRLPQHIGWEKASLVEPFSCVMNGQEKIEVGVGDFVVILGAGPIGLMHVKLARYTGAYRIMVSEPNPARRVAALSAGADYAVDPTSEDLPERVKHETKGQGADKVIVAIGVPKLANDALQLVRKRGFVSLFAGFSASETATLDVNAIHYGEIQVTGSFGLTRLQFERSLNMIAQGHIELDSLLTHRFGLDQIDEALKTAENGGAIKVVVAHE